MKIPQNIIQKAMEVALTSNVRRGKVSAIIFTRRGNIEVFTSNCAVLGKVVEGKDKHRSIFTIHAEAYALAKAIRSGTFRRNKMSDLFLLIVRVKPSTMKLSNARPCEKCQVLVQESGIKTYYSDIDGNIKKFQ